MLLLLKGNVQYKDLEKNKNGPQSVGADLTTIAKKVGFKYHSTIVWNEGNR